MSSNVFMNNQLERIADYIDAGKAGGGTLTVNLSGVGDMTGATAGQAGTHGLVPAPAAGDQDKVLSGAGTWEDLPQYSGGVNYSTSEQDTGLKWIDGKSIFQKTITFTVTGGGYISNPTGITGIETLIKHEGIGIINGYIIDETAYNNPPTNAYSIAIIYFLQNGELFADYRATDEAVGATFYITFLYTKI